MATPQSQAIADANEALAIDAAIAALKTRVDAFLIAWADHGSANYLNSMATCALNADGSLGTADGSPNTAHPINTALYPALNRAMSASAIAAIVGYPIPNFQAMCNGAEVSAVGGLRAIINGAAGG